MNRREILGLALGSGIALTVSGPVSARTGLSQIKISLVGDSGVGKTSMLIAYTTNFFPVGNPPAGFNSYTQNLLYEGSPTLLELADTPGSEDHDRLRPLSYPDSDVAAIGFAIDRRSSFDAVSERWLPEIRQHLPSVPWVLVGMKADLRDQSDMAHAPEISSTEAAALAQALGAFAYIENSALTQHNLAESFQTMIRAAQGEDASPRRRREIRPGQGPLTPARRRSGRGG